jgi:hypothetical protein
MNSHMYKAVPAQGAGILGFTGIVLARSSCLRASLAIGSGKPSLFTFRLVRPPSSSPHFGYTHLQSCLRLGAAILGLRAPLRLFHPRGPARCAHHFRATSLLPPCSHDQLIDVWNTYSKLNLHLKKEIHTRNLCDSSRCGTIGLKPAGSPADGRSPTLRSGQATSATM